MSTMANILLDKEILLESGTNELELLVFDVADYTFGINVAKVREVLPTAEITALPRAHSSIRGVFKLRSNVIPCVSLLDHLGIEATSDHSESNMILTDFNQQQTAFLVDGVERIHRLSWENILAVPGLDALSHTPVTALARCDNRLIVMLDFEMILDDVTDQYFRTDVVDNPLGLPREQLKIMLAEDSPTVREAIGNTLRNSGYTQLFFFDNGAEAWDWMQRMLKANGRREDVCDLIISDVEMPQIDGFHLTKRVKEHTELKHIPVLLYSSIITPDNHKKGQAVGADAQVAKPELNKVVQLADELISASIRDSRAEALREVTTVAQTSIEEAAISSEPAPNKPEVAAETPKALPSASPAPVAATPAPSAPVAPAPAADPEPAVERPTLADDLQESPAPRGVDHRLWRTFHNELVSRRDDLRTLLVRLGNGDRQAELTRELARVLHTIKSASMVIPLDQVTRCTHLAESLLERHSQDPSYWPQELLEDYLDWLTALVLPPNDDTDAALALGTDLATRLEG